MSVALYVDHHVPAAITDGLRSRGIDVLTALEDGTDQLEDRLLLERATQLARPVFTMDEDFLILAREFQATQQEFAGIIYTHQQHFTVGQAVRDLELIAMVMDHADLRNQVVWIPF